MRQILHWLGIALAIAAIGYFIVTGLTAVRQLDLGTLTSPANAIALVASALLYFISYPINGWAWARILADFGATQPNRRAVMIMSLTQLAKYVPGNVGQPLGRIAMGVRYGIPTIVTVRSMMYESALAVLALMMTAMAGIAFSGLPQLGVHAAESIRLALSLALAAALSLVGIALLPHAEIWLRRISPSAWAVNWPVRGLPKRTAAQCLAAYAFNSLAIGLGFFLVASAIEPQIPGGYLFLTAVFAVSWLAGFVTPGVPAGLGVREGVMVALISPQYGAANAVTIVLAQRLATILGDLIGFGLGSVLSFLERRDNPTSGPERKPSMQLEPTSERMVIEHYQGSIEQYLIYLFHRATYDFAEQFVRDKRVLDFGCGSGYGTAQLAIAAREIIGVDVAPDAVEHARLQYVRPNLRFERVTADAPLPFADGSFETVLSFQVIEHVRDPVRYLAEIGRVLAPTGVLVLATPDRSTRLFRFQKPWNRWHIIEYDTEQLHRVLATNFGAIRLLHMGGRPALIDIELKRCSKLRLLTLPFTLPFVPEIVRIKALGALHRLSMRDQKHVASPKSFPYDVSDITIHEDAAPSVNLIAVATPSQPAQADSQVGRSA